MVESHCYLGCIHLGGKFGLAGVGCAGGGGGVVMVMVRMMGVSDKVVVKVVKVMDKYYDMVVVLLL